jgi:hypothetical protein
MSGTQPTARPRGAGVLPLQVTHETRRYMHFYVDRAQLDACRSTAQHVATQRNMLQHSATCCSAAQRVATQRNVSQHSATYRNTAQRIATSHSALPLRPALRGVEMRLAEGRAAYSHCRLQRQPQPSAAMGSAASGARQCWSDRLVSSVLTYSCSLQTPEGSYYSLLYWWHTASPPPPPADRVGAGRGSLPEAFGGLEFEAGRSVHFGPVPVCRPQYASAAAACRTVPPVSSRTEVKPQT